MNSKSISKNDLRASALALRKQLSSADRTSYSGKIISALLDHMSCQRHHPENLLSYRAMSSEVNTDALLTMADYRLFFPVTQHHEQMSWHQVDDDTRWRAGVFGVLEPDSQRLWQAEGVTTLLCPLSAFDRMGNRLGMGKGCFDYWLSTQREHIYQIIGLAFSCQEVAEIPAEGHDVPMDFVITEREVIACPKR